QLSFAIFNLALAIGAVRSGLADVNGALREITHTLLGGFETRVHHQRIKPCLQPVPPLDRAIEPFCSLIALVQSAPDSGSEIIRKEGDIAIPGQVLRQAVELAQVGRNTQYA